MTYDQQAENLGRAIARDMNAMERSDLTAQKAAFLAAQGRPRKRSYGLVFAVGAPSLAVALVLAFVWRATPVGFEVEGQPGNEGQEIAAASRSVPLQFADGSVLNLAAGSNLRIDKASRKAVVVRLGTGHLDAAVTHGTALRWRFDANRYSVHIVGTKFALTSEGDGIGVDVTEGAIRISVPGVREDVRVVAGQHFSGRDGKYSVEAQVKEEPPAPPPEEPAPPPAKIVEKIVESQPAKQPPRNDNWRKQLAHGQYDGAIATVKRLGLAEVTSSATANELTDLADAARLARDAETAKHVFESLTQRFPKSRETKRVPFLLGRVVMELEQNPKGAAKHFAAYIAGDPQGELVEEAYGRQMEAWRAAGDTVKAKETAVRYLERYPEGTYAALARAIGGS